METVANDVINRLIGMNFNDRLWYNYKIPQFGKKNEGLSEKKMFRSEMQE